MYIKHCKISKNKQSSLLKYFVAGSTDRTVANLVGTNRNIGVRYFYHKLRKKTALNQQNQQNSSKQFIGEIEVDKWDRKFLESSRHMRKYNGIPKNSFNLFLKECEWRFNIGRLTCY